MAKSPEKISDLLPDRKNRRKHTARNVEMLQESLEKVGTGRSIVIDENNEVLAGNATIKAAQNIGLTKVKVIEVDGTEVVAVRRKGLSDKQKRDLAMYDNRTAELSSWDVEQLTEDIEGGLEMESFFLGRELDDLWKQDGAYHPDLHPEFSQKAITEASVISNQNQLEDHFSKLSSQNDSQAVICPHCSEEFHVLFNARDPKK